MRVFTLVFAAAALAGSFSPVAVADLIWFDGSVDPADEPPGLLLSDNPGYYGPLVRTGIDYSYETEPMEPADVWRDTEEFGRRLLDGRPAGNWWTPVGVAGGPLIVVFDLKSECLLAEVDVDSRSGPIDILAEVGDMPGGPWRMVVQQAIEDVPDQQFHRLRAVEGARGRYVRLTVEAPGISWIDEVILWGDIADNGDEDTPQAPTPGIAAQSVSGVEKMAFPDAAFWEWRDGLHVGPDQRAVWSRLPTWDSLTSAPILPTEDALIDEIELVVARNETEQACLALTNVSWEDKADTEVHLAPFGQEADVSARLLVAGAMPSRYYGTGVAPLFGSEDLLAPDLMAHYLTNGPEISAFPRLVLAPAGSAILWLSVTTDMVEPGVYDTEVSADGVAPLRVRVRVVDAVLPDSRVWLQTYSSATSMFPFVWSDRQEREVSFKRARGISVWNGFPREGTDAALAHSLGASYFHVWGIGDYGHRLYAGAIDPALLTDDDAAAVAELIKGHVAEAEALGLTYDEWYVELTDEPGRGNSEAFGALARLIRAADPNVRIYCNPSFWEETGCAPDDPIFQALSPWYDDIVDVSAPLQLLLSDRPLCAELFDTARPVRAFYNVCSQSAKSERASEVEMYRRQAWEAFSRGWNGWGFYSYFAPRGDPWDDSDADWYTGEDLPDYQIVYPGPRGPITTRQAEALREGWEDYRLLTLLAQRNAKKLLEELIRDFQDGAALTDLRTRALVAAS